MSQELIARLEAATGPDQELDALIWCAVFAPADAYVARSKFNGAWCIYQGTEMRDASMPRLWEGRGLNARVKPVTGSFDAARTLVPDGFYWLVSEGRTRATEPLGGAQVFRPNYLVKPIAEAKHESVIIALCIAALKARAAL